VLLEPRLQFPVAGEVDADLDVPAPEPDRVAGVLDRLPPGVPDALPLFGEERVLAVGRQEDEKPPVPEVLDVRPAGLLPPRLRPLGDADAVPGDELLVHQGRVLVLRHPPGHVKEVAPRDERQPDFPFNDSSISRRVNPRSPVWLR